MLNYIQSTGEWTDEAGLVIVSGCYAGKGACKNQWTDDAVIGNGPLPRGQYTISPLHIIPHLGPAMALTPAPENDMHGRSGFFAHLDNRAHPGESSEGCIVFPDHAAQLAIEARRAAGEDQVTVVP